MREAISKRISRRSYEKKNFSSDEQIKIQSLIDKANQTSGLHIELLEDGSNAFNSLKKSYGMFSGVRSVLLMKGDKCDEHLREKVGYYGEDIVLDLTDMNIGSCWVGGSFNKSLFQIPQNESLVCVIPIGFVANQTAKEKVIRAVMSKKRKSIEERITSDTPLPEYIKLGLEAVRFAPSAVNSQKPKFHYDGKTLTADVPNDYAMDLVDLGIAKRHFEIEAGGSFDFGNGAAFHKIDNSSVK